MQSLLNVLITRAQLKFFRKNQTGCAFAAVAAGKPDKFGWSHFVAPMNPVVIDQAIERAISDEKTTTLSLIFKECKTVVQLQELITLLQRCQHMFLGQDIEFNGLRCLGFRVRVNGLESWASGFGPFDFFPKTRQAPHTELIFRVKPRPAYEKVMKKSPPGVIHLADLDMQGIGKTEFKKLWDSSIERTATLLGHPPDLQSAAKTTFVLPV